MKQFNQWLRLLITTAFILPLSLNAQNNLCNPQFSWQPGQQSNSVHFTPAPSSTAATQYSWNFGDGTTSAMAAPGHMYNLPGIYNVCLTVSVVSPNGTIACTATWCDSVNVGNVPPPPPCMAAFSYQPGTAPLGILLNHPNYPLSTQYLWDFGDGTTSNVDVPNHVFPAPGTYNVCLTITVPATPNHPACTSTWCDSVMVGVQPPPPPPCDAHFMHQPGSIPLSMHFNAAPNPPNTVYSWDFGDGTTSANASPNHIYANPGFYNVCLTVTSVSTTNTILCTAVWCDSIHVGNVSPPPSPCNAHFRFHRLASTNLVHFQAAPNPPNTVYSWNFGDGTTGTGQSPNHQFPGTGNYQVCLTVTATSPNGNTCTETTCHMVHIGPPPVMQPCQVQFMYQHVPQQPLSYQFTSTANPGVTGYLWHFGDATTSTQQNPQHQYTNPGIYQVCLTVFDTVQNCSRTRCHYVFAFNVSNPASVENAEKLESTDAEEPTVMIYPNPFSEETTVNIEDAEGTLLFRLVDMNGREVMKLENVTNGNFTLNRGELKSGIYFYELMNSTDRVAGGKILIQ
jgi:PKD repeat protein